MKGSYFQKEAELLTFKCLKNEGLLGIIR